MLETWKEVENNFKSGLFHATITEGRDVREYDVPAVYLGQSLEFEEEYIKSKLSEGNDPLVTYRIGDKGMCVVIPNPDLLQVRELRRYYTVRSFLGGELKHRADKKDPTGRHLIGGYGECIEVSATTLAGLPFSATISFVPSPK